MLEGVASVDVMVRAVAVVAVVAVDAFPDKFPVKLAPVPVSVMFPGTVNVGVPAGLKLYVNPELALTLALAFAVPAVALIFAGVNIK